jgi:hypothetical protein
MRKSQKGGAIDTQKQNAAASSCCAEKNRKAHQPELQPVFRCCFGFCKRSKQVLLDLSQAFLSCQICTKEKQNNNNLK